MNDDIETWDLDFLRGMHGAPEWAANEIERLKAENERLRASLREIASKDKYGCCRPTIHPDAPACSHDIARNALDEEKE